jgi:hypothetical protein
MTDMPDDLQDLDRKLRSVRFAARTSLGPELQGRLRRGDGPSRTSRTNLRLQLATAAVAVLAAGSALALANLGTITRGESVTVDRCCYDLDGGGDPDDGVYILAEPDARVHRLKVYEDLDDSGNHTPADLIRLDRGAAPTIHGLLGEGVITIERCCLDFDGGGPEDDGLLVIGVPPDRVLMAAIYETATRPRARHAASTGWPLR